jgi:patatin-like phospholipase/acyl hydrolase
MSDIAGSATAAPTYFAPKVFVDNLGKSHMQIDGGIFANNPEELGIGFAMDKNADLKREKIDVISIGTGAPILKIPKSFGILGWLSKGNLFDVMLNAGSILSDKEVHMTTHGAHRFQMNITQGEDSLDNSSPEHLECLLKAINYVIANDSAEFETVVKSLLS